MRPNMYKYISIVYDQTLKAVSPQHQRQIHGQTQPFYLKVLAPCRYFAGRSWAKWHAKSFSTSAIRAAGTKAIVHQQRQGILARCGLFDDEERLSFEGCLTDHILCEECLFLYQKITSNLLNGAVPVQVMSHSWIPEFS